MKKIILITGLAIATLRLSAQIPAYPPAPAPPGNVTKAEYFIDSDPGFGNANNIPLTAAVNLPALVATANTGSLTPGVHRLYVRTLNADGIWSQTSSRLFAVEPNYPIAPATPGNVMKAEYFIDNDPGFGNGSNIPFTAALNIPSLAASINTSALTPGIHRLYVRTRNTEGRWSQTSSRLFAVVPNYLGAPAAPTTVSSAEYFFDTDPGFGQGNNIPLTAAVNIPSLLATVNTGSLTPGIHRLYVRSRGTSGRWSETSSRLFAVVSNYPNAPAAAGNVSKAEYYVDNDPGFGNGTNIPLSAANNIPSLVASINTSALTPGIHRLYVRSRGTEGKWSITSNRLFAVAPNYPGATPAATNVVKAEYFIDTDPGFGNGTNIALSAANNIPALLATINTSSLSAGLHRLYTRTKSAGGTWSITSSKLFATYPNYPSAPAAPNSIKRIEYFFDTDPGFGNGVAVSFVQNVNVPNVTFAVNTSSLSSGTHRLFVRSRDDSGEWSITSVKTFTTVTFPLPLDLLSFDGKKVDSHVDLDWKTTNELNTAYFDVERSPNGVEFETIGQVEAVNMPGDHSYFFQDMQPLNGLNYYRLKQVDQDGKSTYTKVISVLFSSYGEGGVIYPNPATSYVNVETGFDGTQEVHVQVYDMNGKVVMSASENKSALIRLDIAHLAPGHYTIQCSDGNEIISGRFTKQ